jgi:hypothetical protein
MVRQIESWSMVRGRVRAVADDPGRAGFRIVSLDVDGVEPVDGYAHALDAGAASADVAVPREVFDHTALGVGDAVELQVRATPRGLFANPDRVAHMGS